MRLPLLPPASRHLRCATLLGASGIAFVLCGCGSGLRSSATSSAPLSVLTVSAPPKLGYAWNAADKTLRPILGIPGAAQFDDSVTPAGTYEYGAADPTGSVAILLGEAQTLYSMPLPSGSPVLLAAKAADGSKIVFSPQGGSAFIFSPGGTEGKVVSQLAGTPQVRSVSYTGSVLDAAISDAGSVAVALRSANSVPIQVVPASGNAVTLPALKGSGGLSFIAGTDDLLLADSGANSLLRVRTASTGPVVTSIPTAGLLKTPVSVAGSGSARWAVVANSAEASVVRVDLSGSTPAQRTACNCQPSIVSQLTGEGAFRLTSLQEGPVWIGDASKASFPVLFIPALTGAGKVVSK